MLDFETQDGQDANTCLTRANAFMTRVEKVMPASRMLIYTYPSFWNSIGGNRNAPWAARYKLAEAYWIKDWYIANQPLNLFYSNSLATLKAQINSGALLPMQLLPWKTPAIWQFTSRVSPSAIPGYVGIKKAADYNAVYPSFGSVPPPVPPTPPAPAYPKYKTAVNVNVRSGAADTDPVIGVLYRNTIVEVDTTSGTRSHTISPNPTGWIYSTYLIKI